MSQKFTPTEYEIEVMQMSAGKLPWEKGAWINACVEFLQEAGFMESSGKLTTMGSNYLSAHTIQAEEGGDIEHILKERFGVVEKL
jgi:hypothetical protein